jgi:hypothetical protein
MSEISWSTIEAVADSKGIKGLKKKKLRRVYDQWIKEVHPINERTRKSGLISESDLAIRINVKDHE